MEVYYKDIEIKRTFKARSIINFIILLVFLFGVIYYYFAYSNLVSENQSNIAEIESLQKVAQRLYTNNENLKLILEDYDKLTWKLKKEINRLIIYQKNMERKLKQAEGRQ